MAQLINEKRLMLSLAKSIYSEDIKNQYFFPEQMDWNDLFQISSDNKVLLHIARTIRNQKEITLNAKAINFLDLVQKKDEAHHKKLRKTLEIVNNVLGDNNYVLLKTFRNYPYLTHDVDILVKDFNKAKNLFRNKGFSSELPWYELIEFSTHKKGLLEIEVYDKFGYGSMKLIDSDFLWKKRRNVKIEGINTWTPSPEGDILSLIARMNFQMYKIGLGDILYIFTCSKEADWTSMIYQTKKYKWYKSFSKSISVLNMIHRELFGKPAITEKKFGLTKIQFNLPYIVTMQDFIIALSSQGWSNLIRLPSVYTVRIQNRNLKNAYSYVINERLAGLFIKYLYH